MRHAACPRGQNGDFHAIGHGAEEAGVVADRSAASCVVMKLERQSPGGKLREKPSASMAAAPPPPSSAGWPTIIKVPRHRSLCSAMSRAVPAQADM